VLRPFRAYRMSAVATDASGNRGLPVSIDFNVRPNRRF
jgi:hypothetical protein